ncbi:ATP synthase subunit H, mitochondrial [Psilocybe cubensis]|uniref:ATP synthase subunit H, mitochondrial n=2 Tax=Psilocybe cubensis TaxID=181762 RepID=A0ACB8GM95_PSICU|nr:ATP synthase subunit H, mitochondrial [Psilocybe cubensis]KAH9476823.1 ATP synthase subunit H, mitochondrial [Psilocybe cubensis]
MSTILRQAASVARQTASRRAFSVSAGVRKDLVQDLYIREIKAYKPAPTAKDAHVGAVKKFTAPAAPVAPALPADLAAELNTYATTEPTLADATASTKASEPTEASTGGADAFLAFLEEDLPKPVHHH